MSTKLWAALLVLCMTAFTSAGQIFYKLGSKTLEYNLQSIISNYYILAGILVYSIGGIGIIIALKYGEVSVLYPIIATSYIWVSLSSVFFLGESMNIFKWIGVILIMAGVTTIGLESKETAPGAL